MKYDLSRKPTRGAERVLSAFRTALFGLLEEELFENIKVNELCERAGYPRATFYNYFDDKYDMLGYCWIWLASEIGLHDYEYAPHKQMLYLFFDRICAYTDSHLDTIRGILAKNPESGYLFSSLRVFVDTCMRDIFKDCPDAEGKPVPRDLFAAHYSQTLLLVWQWRYLRSSPCTNDEARGYLEHLLGSL